MQEQDSNVAYEYVLKTYPRGQEETHPIGNSCNRPWKTATIDMYTNCMLCVCDGWLPMTVGEITDFQNLEDIWRNPKAVEIQNNVAEKKFTWCAVEHCGIKHQNNYEDKYQLVFGIDDSCNLQCPSCRREKRMHDSGPMYEKKLKAVQHATELLNKFEPRIHIVLACSGDPLASHIYRPFLHSYRGTDNQTFTLFTNGLLIKKQLEKTALLDRITEFRISIDAGSEDVYRQVRVGGQWHVLMENFDYLREQKLADLTNLVYVVQKNNYTDIPNFVNLCKKYNFRGILAHLDDWGTWNRDTVKYPDAWTIKNGTFREHNILDSNHELYEQCQTVVKSVINTRGINLTPRLKQLLQLYN